MAGNQKTWGVGVLTFTSALRECYTHIPLHIRMDISYIFLITYTLSANSRTFHMLMNLSTILRLLNATEFFTQSRRKVAGKSNYNKTSNSFSLGVPFSDCFAADDLHFCMETAHLSRTRAFRKQKCKNLNENCKTKSQQLIFGELSCPVLQTVFPTLTVQV